MATRGPGQLRTLAGGTSILHRFQVYYDGTGTILDKGSENQVPSHASTSTHCTLSETAD